MTVPGIRRAQRAQHREAAARLLAQTQYGVLDTRQLAELGFRKDAVRRRIDDGRWVRAHRGVVRIGHRTEDVRQRAWEAQLAYGSLAVVSHLTAAMLWGFVKEAPGPVHLTLPNDRADRPGVITHESRTTAGVRIFYGLRVTDPVRTLVDLADLLTTDELERALSDAHRLGYVDQHAMTAPRTPGRRGLTEVLKRGTRMTRSQFERAFLRAIRAAGDLPLPEMNVQLHGYEADAYWRDARLVAELDHYATHGSRIAFERDRRKQTEYALHGILTIRITPATLPTSTATIRRLITDRGGRI